MCFIMFVAVWQNKYFILNEMLKIFSHIQRFFIDLIHTFCYHIALDLHKLLLFRETMAFLSRITPITVQPTAEALASIIFLHGSGLVK